MEKSESLFQEAQNYIPGGVNSPVRAFGNIGITPRFIERAEGVYLYDADGRKYLDFICSWGPMILGHNQKDVLESVMDACKWGLSFGAATEREVVMAKLITEMVPAVEMVRMVNSGTEAVMSAIRVARGYTKRKKIVKFSGCYHGHSDSMLVSAGSGVMTSGMPDSAGVTKGCTKDTISAVYNDLSAMEELFASMEEEIAAVIVEPVAANMGVVPPKPGFLEGLRELCTKYGSLLIFDEVITGFRLGAGGASEYFKVTPDLITFGKIIGAGMPVGAYGGKREIMEMVAPVGAVYQAGTLSGNPVAMAAGIAQLTILKEHPEIYTKLNRMGDWFYGSLKKQVEQAGVTCQVNHIGSLGCLFFTEHPVTDYESAKTSNTAQYADYFKYMLEHGVNLAPSQFEAMFLSASHKKEELEKVLELASEYFQSYQKA
ncbi:MAG: glutamate-1-semialdehyde 2,1-aminomutase [Lachnospiraceae bacterium]|nr:glutamate-1-semialdehyde 2,1-aminomutase [Lachnospiraceae bacterium]